MTQPKIKEFQKIMVANRGEIAIRIFRACTELGIQTMAIYSEEDRLHLHRYKADEAYQVGKGKSPVSAYLDYEEILELAVDKEVDAIHPGYGFLSENAGFARACEAAGIVFIGPPVSVLESMGDKVFARAVAKKVGVPVIPGTEDALETEQDALIFAREFGFPLIIKAALGGGGRGMTIVRNRGELLDAFSRSRAEAQAAFGNPKIFMERYLEKPKHIEVQIMGDRYGEIVHLFERDCSIQRRHQKVVEIAPALDLPGNIKEKLYRDALAICKEVNYINAGTVEFLVDTSGNHYFIEVNPRIQVEHTITEVITGRDLVQTQIRVAEGYPLSDERIRIPSQDKVKKSGFAIQLRITTEDPANDFAPDSGRITAFRAGEGFGIRLDAGSGFEGAIISPHYDSLLIKLTAWSLDFDQAAQKALRAIREFRIRGVRTNLPFLENLLKHPMFLAGHCNTGFIENHPEVFRFKPKQNRANKLLRFVGGVVVNGFKGIDRNFHPGQLPEARPPHVPPKSAPTSEAYRVFEKKGAEALSKWVSDRKSLLLTDTTMRDAHQSLLATRMRTYDMLRIAPATAYLVPQLFSLEMWGGATFDVAFRFLHECPWKRLRSLRKAIPGSLFQMLLRSGNAVGYTNYPDNVVNRFIELAAEAGIDVFRIFDCLNWVEAMKPSMETVGKAGKIIEASICYSGDVTDNTRVRFTMDYYLKRAKALEKAGAHILAVKDMAGLLKPQAARILISGLKESLTIPVHLHTHDTSGNGIACLLEASNAGVDIVDGALSSMSGITSQPSLNTLVTALQGTDRDPGMEPRALEELADYWEAVREAYAPYECGLKASTADVYRHEIPGGQYSNFKPQATAVGLGDRWKEVKTVYRRVNDMLGEVIKVTPSSKAVGDMALFMVQNNLTPEKVITHGKDLAFPDSFVALMKGMMGQVDGGFPKDLQKAVLKGEQPITCRPGELLEDFDFKAAETHLRQTFGRKFNAKELVSYALYPKVFEDYCHCHQSYGDVSVLDTSTFFYGLEFDQEKAISIEEGKTLIVKLLTVGELQADGNREAFYELNGTHRNILVRDFSSGIEVKANEKADPSHGGHVPAPMLGTITKILIAEGEVVEEGQKLLTTEAMKMVNVVVATSSGTVKRVVLDEGDRVEAGDLLVEIA